MMAVVNRVQVLMLLTLLGFMSTCFAQEKSASKREQQSLKDIEIRNLFVPEDAASVVLGELKNTGQQYLPIDSKSIKRLLAAKTSKDLSSFQMAEFDMALTGEDLLTGVGSFFVPESIDPISIEFQSNVFFNEPKSARVLGAKPLIGTKASGRTVFQTKQGGWFTANATALLNSNQRFSTLQFPAASNGAKVRISVPRSLKLYCKQQFGVVHQCNEQDQGIEVDQYLVESTDGRVDILVLDRVHQTRTIDIEAELNFDMSYASVFFKTRLDPRQIVEGGLVIKLPDGFTCSNVLVNDIDVAFQIVGLTKDGKGSGVQVGISQGQLPDSKYNLTVRCERKLGKKSALAFGGFSISGNEVGQYRLSIPRTSAWEYERIVSAGFVIQEGEVDRLFFSQAMPKTELILEVVKNTKPTETERLSVSAASGIIKSIQVIVNARRNAILKLNEGWEIKSIVDVQQDEFPLAINRRRTDTGAILLLSNEENVIRIVAEKKVNPRVDYSVRDFLIVPMVGRDSTVEFTNGFADDQTVRISADSGLPEESDQNGQVQTVFEAVEDCRFQFSSQSGLVSVDNEYLILIEVSQTSVKARYLVSVRGGASGGVNVVGISGVDQWTTTSIGQKVGTLMSDDEKRLLGLDLTLPFWILPNAKEAQEKTQFVSEVVFPLDPTKALNVPLPFSVAGIEPRGEIQLVCIDSGMRILVQDLDEVPSQLRFDDARKFVISGVSPKIQIQQQDVGASVDSIEPVSRKLTIRSNGSRHEKIHCVIQRGAVASARRPESENAPASNDSVSNDSVSNDLEVYSFFQIFVSVDERLIDAWMSIGERDLRGQNAAGVWEFRIPHTIFQDAKPLEIVLNMRYAKSEQWVISSENESTVTINGKLLELDCQAIEVSRSYVSVYPHFAFSSSVNESLVSVLWLPLQICDTATAKDLFGSYFESLSNQQPALQSAYVIRREVLISIGVCLFFLAVAYGVVARRLRYVLMLALVSIALGMVLNGVAALVFCFLFWGSSFGVVIRELRFLCTFRRLVPALVLLGTLFPPILNGQETKNSSIKLVPSTDEKEIRYIVYPVDKDSKTMGIGYLPRDLYEMATEDTVSKSPIFHSSSIQIDATNDPKSLRLLFSFDVTCFEGEITLPYFFDEAVFLEDTISVNGRIVDFLPDLKNQIVNVSLSNPGRKKIDIELYQQLPVKAFEIKLPTSGLVAVTNNSALELLAEGSGFSTESSLNRPTKKILKQGVRTFLYQNRVIGFAVSRGNGTVSVLEDIEFSKNLERRTVVLINDASAVYDVKLTVPSNHKFTNTGDANLLLDPSTDTITVLELSKIQEIVFEKKSNVFGVFHAQPIDVRDVKVQTHFLRLNGGDGVSVNPNSNNSSAFRTQTELISEFSSIENNPEIRAKLVNPAVAIFDAKVSLPSISVTAEQTSVTGSSIHRHFMSAASHRIDAEFNVSFSTPLESFLIVLPDGFEMPTVELGSVRLPTYRMSPRKIIVVTKELQAGAYRFVINSQRKISSPKRTVSTIEFDLANVITTHQIWLDRTLRVKPSPALIPPLTRQINGRFLLAGTLSFDEGVISLVNKGELASDVISMEDAIRFRNGRVLHGLQIMLQPEMSSGIQIGISLPLDATEIEMVTKSCALKVERSDLFGAKQIWISPEFGSSNRISVTFESELTGNGVGLPSLIGQSLATKSVVVPRRFSDDELIWNIAAAKPSGQKVICRLPATQDFLRYEVEERIEPTPLIELVEYVFHEDESTLACRFYLSPNGAKEIRLQIDLNQHLVSATLCGRFRQAIRLPDGEYKFDLLDHRFSQTLDLVIQIPKLDRTKQLIHLPHVFDWPIEKSFIQFQIHEKHYSEKDLRFASFSEVDSSRKIYFRKAVETFDLNRSKLSEISWRETLLKLSQIAGIDFDSNKYPSLSRANDLLAEGSWKPDGLVFDKRIENEISADKPVWILSGNNVSIELFTPGRKINYSWMVSVVVWTVALGTLGILLQRWFPKLIQPLFSFSLITCLWLFSVAWIILTPQSIFAWCLIILAFCMAFFFVINAVEFVRSRRRDRLSTED